MTEQQQHKLGKYKVRECKSWIGGAVFVPRGGVGVEVCSTEWHIYILWADKDFSNTLHTRMMEIITVPCSQTACKKKVSWF